MIIAIDDVVMMEKSNSLTAIANNINTLSNDINAEITKLQEAWRSEASDLLCQRFTALAQSFTERYEVIKSYAAFLAQAAEAYRTNEANSKKPLE